MKKGFTLVELLAVVFILGIIVTIVSISSLNTIKEANEKAFLLLVSQIEGAAEDYAINYSDILTKLTPSNTTAVIPLSELQQKKLLENKITDPRNDGEIKSTEQVKIERKTDGSIAYTFLYSDAASYKPSIGLMGASSVYLEQGQAYIEAGAVATDYSGKDISSRISITGTVNTGVAGIYELGYSVTDPLGNTSEIITRTIEVIASQSPTVAFGTNGNATYATMHSTSVAVSDNVVVNPTSLEYQWTTSTTAPTEVSFTTSFTNGGTVNSPAGVTGGYYLWILAKDTAGNTAIVKSNVFNLDNTIPTVAFGTNGSTTYAKTRSTTVTVSDNGAVDTTNLKYQWTISDSKVPAEDTFTTTFTNGGTITKSSGDGTYFLWILAKDLAGNTTITASSAFNFDNTAPVISILGSNPVTFVSGVYNSTYSDAGAAANDSRNGTLTSSIVTTNNINQNALGTYTVTYTVSDSAGNTATATRTVIMTQLRVEYLVVAGGGGGGAPWGGAGGGAGGYLTGETEINGNINITVGGGGASNANGGNSVFGTVTAIGGGRGSGAYSSPSVGGSGGGGRQDGNTYAASGTAGQGNAGGRGYDSEDSSGGGGGGGAGAAGASTASRNGGQGGIGLASSITGVSIYRAGGGGGGSQGGVVGAGGTGGGGAGASGTNATGGSGAPNTGGGGGGGGTGISSNGGAGGSGVVIVRYYGPQKATGGTITTWNGYTIHSFTTVGSATFTVN